MKERLICLFRIYFSSTLDLRVRIFNILALAGCVGAIVIGIVNGFSGAGFTAILTDVVAAALSAGLLYYSYRTQRYRYCYLVTIVVIFLGLFPYLFFTMGGYHGGIPMFFIFAVVFTVFMLEGKLAVVVMVVELALYSGLLFYSYKNPNSITTFPAESGFFMNVLVAVRMCGD
jgi:hypothetical protein